MKSGPGTYAFILRCTRSIQVQIGRWGVLQTRPGFYIYVGSAFGPGGIRSRVARHFRMNKRHHWHIDYLRAELDPAAAWACYSTARLEHDWANVLHGMEGVTAVQGFGCSDCQCYAHLFYTAENPEIGKLRQATGTAVELFTRDDILCD